MVSIVRVCRIQFTAPPQSITLKYEQIHIHTHTHTQTNTHKQTIVEYDNKKEIHIPSGMEKHCSPLMERGYLFGKMKERNLEDKCYC